MINMRFFDYAHLPLPLQEVSRPIAELAHKMNNDLPNSAEKTTGLRKLLEAKDCFVRAELEKRFPETPAVTPAPAPAAAKKKTSKKKSGNE